MPALVLGLVGLSACGIVDSLSPEGPDVPEGYPQLGAYDGARIDVAVDGVPLDATGFCAFDESGVDEDKLRFSLDVDHLRLSVRARDEGEYSSEADEVTARWNEAGVFDTSPDCGESLVNFDGEKPYDGPVGDEVATWGTLQLVVCDEDTGEELEVSGRFSCNLF